MNEYKNCIVVLKNNHGVCLSAMSCTSEQNGNTYVVWDNEKMIGAFSADEVKAILFCDVSDAQSILAALTKTN